MTIKQSVIQALQNKQQRHEALKGLLAHPDAANDRNIYRDLSKEFSQLTPLATLFGEYQKTRVAIEEANDLLAEGDAELQQLARLEIKHLDQQLEQLEAELLIQLPIVLVVGQDA